MAVYTHVTHDEIAAWLAQHYALPPLLRAEGITQGVENSNYLLHFAPVPDGAADAPTHAILTLYEKRVNVADLPYFLGLMQHVASGAVAVPQPVAQRTDGALWGMLAGKAASVTRFLPGQNMATPTAARMHALGVGCAQLHAAGHGFALQRSNDLSPFALAPLVARCGDAGLERLRPGLAMDVAKELAFLAAHQPRGLPQAHIHADLFRDNVFFDGDALTGLIDFYFACTDAAIYDLAVVANAWCMDEQTGAMEWELLVPLLAGYGSVRALTDAERAAFPILARGAAVRFFLTRAHDWIHQVPGADVVVKDPMEYWRKWQWHVTQHAQEAVQ